MATGLDRLMRAAALGALGLALGTVMAPPPALARSSVHIGLGFGFPIYPPPPPVIYAPPPYYYGPPPPPVVYGPPPYAYAPPPPPPPVYAAPPADYAPPPGQQCREYQTTTIIGGKPEPTVGTACLQADGTWRIVR
jgi:hypothetical protein